MKYSITNKIHRPHDTKVKSILEAAGVPQVVAAHDLGWSVSKLNRVAQGRYNLSHADKLKLSQYLDVDVSCLA